MSTWTIARRLATGFAVVLGIVVALSGFIMWELRTVSREVDVITGDALPGVVASGVMESQVRGQTGVVLEHVLAQTADDMRKHEQEIDAAVATVNEVVKVYESTIRRDRDRELFAATSGPRQEYRAARTRVIELSRAMKKDEAMRLFNTELQPALAKYVASTTALFDYNRQSAVDAAAGATSAVSSVSTGTLLGVAIALVLGVAIAWVIVTSTRKVLSTSVQELTQGSEQVVSAAAQVAGASQSLSQGATEQAASLEETSASMEEMAAMTRQNAEHSQQAAVLMGEVDARVRESNTALREMVTSMTAIEQSSQQVAQIIKTIDEIAFQTNILALNAAVEAARAGTAGMGFAVVADEVRALAQRSAQAAKDTSTLIAESVVKAQSGTTRVDEVAKAIAGITESVTKVKGLVEEVSSASRQQAQGIDQVSQAVAQMEKVTQTNAASAEESAAASEELNAQAETSLAVVRQLQGLVGGTGERQRQDIPRPVAPPSKTVVSMAQRRAAKSAMDAEDAIPLQDTGTFGKF